MKGGKKMLFRKKQKIIDAHLVVIKRISDGVQITEGKILESNQKYFSIQDTKREHAPIQVFFNQALKHLYLELYFDKDT